MNALYSFIGSIFLAWPIYLSTCEAKPEPIRGGKFDIRNEAIWSVSIQLFVRGTWIHACGGSLVSEKDIITAAHCFVRFACGTLKENFPNKLRDLKKEKFRVIIGLRDLTLKDITPNNGIEKKIKRVFIHKDYEKRGIFYINDIAVIRLKKPLNNQDEKIHPRNKFGYIPLFRTDKVCKTDNCIGREAFGSGFGVTDIKADGEIETNGWRKILRVHFTDKLECPYPGLKLVHYIRQAPTVQGFCMGDSGGPLYFKNYNNNSFELVGVISSGPCGCDLRPIGGMTSKITFIPEYLDFIESIQNVDERKIRKRKSLEKYEKTGVMYFVLPDHNNIAKLKYFNNTSIISQSSLK